MSRATESGRSDTIAGGSWPNKSGEKKKGPKTKVDIGKCCRSHIRGDGYLI